MLASIGARLEKPRSKYFELRQGDEDEVMFIISAWPTVCASFIAWISQRRLSYTGLQGTGRVELMGT